jgi:hypothetical protein
MGVSKERLNFLKWRKDNFPLLRTEDSESNLMWLAWQGCAALAIKGPTNQKKKICPRCKGVGLVPTDMNRGGQCWLCKGQGILKKDTTKKLKSEIVLLVNKLDRRNRLPVNIRKGIDIIVGKLRILATN